MKRIILIIFVFSSFFGFSQNLVPNNGFDNNKNNNSKFIPDLWESDFLYGSYFIECPICKRYHGSGKPREISFNSNIKPKTGICYAGFYAYSYSNKRGYWGIKLKEKLVKDKKYNVEMFVNRYSESGIWLKNLEILFTDNKPNFVNSEFPLNKKTYNKYSENNRILCLSDSNKTWLNKDNNKWIKISGIYKAQGGENFITIGNFKNNSETEHLCGKHKEKNDSTAYYFIDDIKVEEITTKLILPPDKPLVLKNIFFKTGKYNLLPASYPELNKLVNYLNENPDKKIEISGHTDNVGNDSFNKKLSENRAKAVVNYILSKGIKKERLKYAGYGSSKPVDTNKTAQGRQNNRRVEVIIMK